MLEKNACRGHSKHMETFGVKWNQDIFFLPACKILNVMENYKLHKTVNANFPHCNMVAAVSSRGSFSRNKEVRQIWMDVRKYRTILDENLLKAGKHSRLRQDLLFWRNTNLNTKKYWCPWCKKYYFKAWFESCLTLGLIYKSRQGLANSTCLW